MALDHAAQFLAKVLPWPRSEDDKWFVNIHAPVVFKDGHKAWGGRACRTLREAENYIEFVQRRVAEQANETSDRPKFTGDIYVCMSAQRTAKGKTDKRGRDYYAAARSADAAEWHLAFYIDVDAKPEYHGDSKATQLAFAKFLLDTGLPFPTFLVESGSGGFHAHWVFDEPIKTARWRPLSQMLVTAMRHHGFKTDYPCTTTPERVLRVPDTWNYKTDPPKPVRLAYAGDTVWSLAHLEEILRKYEALAPPPLMRITRPTRDLAMPEGFGQISSHAGPVEVLLPNPNELRPSINELRKCCPFVDKTMDNGGENYREPLWFLTGHLAYYCKEGEDAFHIMSKQHRDYDPAKTHERYELEVAKRIGNSNWGWPRCQTIFDAGSTECSACPWMISGEAASRSPFHFIPRDYKAPTAHLPPPLPPPPVTEDDFGPLPEGYVLIDGVIHKILPEDEETSEIPPPQRVWSAVTRQFWLSENPEAVVFDVLKTDGSWRQCSILTREINDSGACRVALGERAGIALTDAKGKEARDLMVAFSDMLKERKNRTILTEPYGWSTIDDKAMAWNYARIRFNSHGNMPMGLTDPVLQQEYDRRGTPDAFHEVMKIIHAQKRPELEMIVALAFGTPFMEFTSQRGLITCFRSTASGRGKSGSLYAGQSVWGNPLKVTSFNGTDISLDNKLAALRNLPIMYDEFQASEEKGKGNVISQLFTITQGVSRARSGRDGKSKPVQTWSTIVICATNQSIKSIAEDYGYHKSEAPSYRVMEIEVGPRIVPASSNYEDAFGKLFRNYGHAGYEMSVLLGGNPELLREETLETQRLLKQLFKAADKERLWLAGMTCALMGAKYANRTKQANFDISSLTAFCRREFARMQRDLDQSPAGFDKIENKVKLLVDFWNDPQTVTVTTNKFPVGPGNHHGKIDCDQMESLRYAKTIDAQIARDEKKLIFSKRSLTDFAKRRSYGASAVNDWGLLNPDQVYATLGRGTPWANEHKPAREKLLMFDLQRPELQDWFDLKGRG